ncbi:O-antigen ligase family protein [Rossellomorea marisflavi]|uniref:O-antigen ligase family protein n=1 Tax=Rossellomorea marisflavi TaxID=189381 RepID=UPI00345D8B0F
MLSKLQHLVLLAVIALVVPSVFTHPVVAYLSTLLSLFFIAWNKKNGLLLLFIYFPIRPFLLELNPGFKLMGDCLLIVLFLAALYGFIRDRGSWKTYAFTGFILLFCLVGTIAAFQTGVGLSAIIFQNRAYLITFLILFIVGQWKMNKEDIRYFLQLSIVMGSILSVHGIIEYLFSRTFLVPEAWTNWNLSSVNEMRVYGLTANPNVLGTYLSICLFITLYVLSVAKRWRILYVLASILMLGTLCLTYSRGSILAFGIAFIVYMLWKRAWKMGAGLILSIVLGLFLIYYPAGIAREEIDAHTISNGHMPDVPQEEVEPDSAPPPNERSSAFSNRFKEIFSDDIIEKSSQWGRLYVVFKGLDIYLMNPVVGTGFGTFGDSATLSYGTPIAERYQLPDRMYSDNQYIQLLVQTGTLGTVSVLAFVVAIFIITWKRRKDPVAPVLFCLTLATLLMALFYNVLEEKILTLYFYSVLGYFLTKERTPHSLEK